MRKCIGLLTIALVAAMGATSVLGQSKVGTACAQWLQVGSSARVAGMAEAFTAIADDASAVFYNPAGTALLRNREFMGNHTTLPADINVEHVAYVHPLSPILGVVSLGFTNVWMDDMKRTDVFGGPEGSWTGEYFVAGAYAAQLSYARSLTDRFAVGMSLRYIYDLLDSGGSTGDKAAGTGMGADIGTIYDTQFYGLKVGMVIRHFGPDMSYLPEQEGEAGEGESYPQPMIFKVGMSTDIPIGAYQTLTIDVEGHHPNDNEERGLIGLEWKMREFFALRTGYKVNHDTETWSGGLGVYVPTGIGKLKADFSYSDYTYLKDLMRVSLGFEF
jgi:hypothetical protein